MKVLFLDVDGVLATGRSIMARGYDGHSNKGFDPIACEMIQKICDKFGYQLVISSTWKSLGKEKLQGIMLLSAIAAPWHEDWRTPRTKSGSRVSDITAWLDNHPEVKKEDCVIVDDMDCRVLRKTGCCVVVCDGDTGFSLNDYRCVFEHNKEKVPMFLL